MLCNDNSREMSGHWYANDNSRHSAVFKESHDWYDHKQVFKEKQGYFVHYKKDCLTPVSGTLRPIYISTDNQQ